MDINIDLIHELFDNLLEFIWEQHNTVSLPHSNTAVLQESANGILSKTSTSCIEPYTTDSSLYSVETGMLKQSISKQSSISVSGHSSQSSQYFTKDISLKIKRLNNILIQLHSILDERANSFKFTFYENLVFSSSSDPVLNDFQDATPGVAAKPVVNQLQSLLACSTHTAVHEQNKSHTSHLDPDLNNCKNKCESFNFGLPLSQKPALPFVLDLKSNLDSHYKHENHSSPQLSSAAKLLTSHKELFSSDNYSNQNKQDKQGDSKRIKPDHESFSSPAHQSSINQKEPVTPSRCPNPGHLSGLQSYKQTEYSSGQDRSGFKFQNTSGALFQHNSAVTRLRIRQSMPQLSMKKNSDNVYRPQSRQAFRSRYENLEASLERCGLANTKDSPSFQQKNKKGLFGPVFADNLSPELTRKSVWKPSKIPDNLEYSTSPFEKNNSFYRLDTATKSTSLLPELNPRSSSSLSTCSTYSSTTEPYNLASPCSSMGSSTKTACKNLFGFQSENSSSLLETNARLPSQVPIANLRLARSIASTSNLRPRIYDKTKPGFFSPKIQS